MSRYIEGLKEAALAACESNDWESTKLLLEQTLDKDSEAYVLLMNIDPTSNLLEEICSLGCVNLLSIFIESGFPVDHIVPADPVSVHNSLFDLLTGCPRLNTLEILSLFENKLNGCRKKGTLLRYAIEGAHLETIKYLIRAGANVNATCGEDDTLLHIAVSSLQLDIVNCLLEAGCNPNVRNSSDVTPLTYAVEVESIELIKLLVKFGADPNCGTSLPLHLAVEEGYIDIIQVLIESGANVNALDGYGESPLHRAVKKKKPESVELLLRYDADADCKNLYGAPPLHYCFTDDQNEVDYATASLLLSNGANCNSCSFNQRPLLFYALSNCSPSMIELMLENDVDVHAYTGRRTIFHYFVFSFSHTIENPEARNNVISIVGMMINWGADRLIMDDDNNTLLHWSAFYGSLKLVQRLVELGLDINARNRDKHKPIDFAVKFGHNDIVEWIVQYNSSRTT